jgi:hypothetical protein
MTVMDSAEWVEPEPAQGTMNDTVLPSITDSGVQSPCRTGNDRLYTVYPEATTNHSAAI